MRHPSTPLNRMSTKARIETLSAMGRSRDEIREQTGASVEYVSQVLRYTSRTQADDRPDADHDRHIAAIRKANKGRTFPSYPADMIERAGL